MRFNFHGKVVRDLLQPDGPPLLNNGKPVLILNACIGALLAANPSDPAEKLVLYNLSKRLLSGDYELLADDVRRIVNNTSIAYRVMIAGQVVDFFNDLSNIEELPSVPPEPTSANDLGG